MSPFSWTANSLSLNALHFPALLRERGEGTVCLRTRHHFKTICPVRDSHRAADAEGDAPGFLVLNDYAFAVTPVTAPM